jgi:cell wall-associated NlpC family hydrolase
MSEEIDSGRVLSVARSWIGTRFHFAGRIRKNTNNSGGIDCIGLVIKVGEEINASFGGKNIVSYDYLTYSKYPNFGEMRDFLDKYFIKISAATIKIGDLAYFNFTNSLEHIAIVSDRGIIHCYLEARSVTEHELNSYWEEKIIGFYRYNFEFSCTLAN